MSSRAVVELSPHSRSPRVVSGSVDADTMAQLRAALRVRQDPALWLETCGSIATKQGNQVITYPDLQLNPFQREVVEIYRYCIANGIPCRIVILKPRQKGSSTISQALFYTHLRNFPQNGIIIADDHSTTKLMTHIWDRYCDHDGFDWGSVVNRDKRGFSNGSKVKLETANDPRAGMGGTWQAVHASEVAYYRTTGQSTGEAVFESLMNAVSDGPNSLVILESTPNGMDGVYYDTYADAVTFADFKNGKRGNGYIKVFYPWYAFEDSKLPITPAQEKEILSTLDQWEKNLLSRYGDQYHITAAHLAWRRDKLTRAPYKHDHSRFNVEFPPDEETCWRTSGSFRFDPDGLTALDLASQGAESTLKVGTLEDGNADTPVRHQRNPSSIQNPASKIQHRVSTSPPLFLPTHRNEAWFRMWEPPILGCRYILPADFMTGEQAAGAQDPDCHAAGVFRDGFTDSAGDYWVPKLVAAIMPESRVDVDILCYWIGLMARLYGNCPVVPEINNSNGLVTLLRQQGCQIWHRTKAPENRRVGEGKQLRLPGWQTTTQSKPQMISSLAARIREEEWSIPCEVARGELRTFMRWPNGDEKAAPKRHDDWVMMQAIASETLRFAVPLVPQLDTITPRRASQHAL